VDDAVVGFLFKNFDILKNLVDRISRDEEEGDVSSCLNDIESFRNSRKGRPAGSAGETLIEGSILKVLSEYEEHRLKSNISDGRGIYLAKAVFTLDVFDTLLAELTKLIKTKGELIATLPTSSDVPAGSIGFNLMFGTAAPQEEIKKDLQFDLDVLVPPKAAQQPVPTPSAPKAPDTQLKSTSTTVRVDIDKLDRILNTIGELTLTKGAIKRIGTELIESYGHSQLVYDAHKISQTLERRIAELQDQVLEIRMVPIGQIFTRLAQIVRRYSREIGKQIDLVVFGEDTELDKYLAEEIVDPLMHLIRNALDHGIESPEERKKKGKKESGTITLKAYQKGNHVVLEVRDDGSGINTERVRKKAIEKGLVAEDAGLEEKEIIDFIFYPGFSTKDVVSEVSGRGVGMDVVRTGFPPSAALQKSRRKGHRDYLHADPPHYAGDHKGPYRACRHMKFAVPLTSMSETLIAEHRDIQTIEWKEVYYLRGEMLPMVRVNKFFNIPGTTPAGLSWRWSVSGKEESA
jgi:two-component system chemotaxis sensor kinase CheA